ncbi:TlpA family protein disulfide reductase, partial [bacterium]
MRAIFLVPLALLAAVSARAAGLTVGDKAPALKVAKWVKGEPIAAFEPGKVYVVEFWATWCGPCKVSIPHLSELAKKYKDKVAFTGVAVWEREKTDYTTKVPQFVEQMGDKMAYRVASDDPEETPMAKTWMQAAGQNGIPSAFIVDQKGEIAWIGHPMLGLDETLEKVVAGTWDKAKFAADFKEEQESKAKYDAYRVELKAAFNEKDPSKAIALIDRTIPQIPLYADDLAVTKWTLLLGSDEKKSYAYAEEISGTVI